MTLPCCPLGLACQAASTTVGLLAKALLLVLDGADENLRAALLDAGADDVLVQPIGLREFVARCRAILRRMQSGSR